MVTQNNDPAQEAPAPPPSEAPVSDVTGGPGEGTPPSTTPVADTSPAAPTQGTPPLPESAEGSPPTEPAVPAQITPEQFAALQAQNQQLEAQSAQFRQQAEQAAVAQQAAQVEAQRQQMVQQAEQAAQNFAAQLTQAGYPQESAQPAIDSFRQNQLQALETEQRATQAIANERGRMNAAMHYAQQYGVSPNDLAQYDSPQSMEAAAKQQQTISQLQSQLAAVQQAQGPPAQSFDSSTTQAGGEDDSGRLPANPTLQDHLKFARANGLPTDFFEQQIARQKRATG